MNYNGILTSKWNEIHVEYCNVNNSNKQVKREDKNYEKIIETLFLQKEISE